MQIKTIDSSIHNKKIILRVDFNVTEKPDLSISDDARIVQALPTIQYLLNSNNTLILISHFGRPNCVNYKFSLKSVAERLQKYLPQKKVILLNDFESAESKKKLMSQTNNEVILLENIRFYPQEQAGDINFAKKLSELAEMYVNDAFGVSHRHDASIVGIPQFLPSYAGLLMIKEIDAISHVMKNSVRPVVSVIGGAKIKTKIHLIEKLIEISDTILIGGALANTFLLAERYEVGKSKVDTTEIQTAKKLLEYAATKKILFCLPKDVVIADLHENTGEVHITKIKNILSDFSIVDIGPETEAEFGKYIDEAGTIIWNGPMGLTEKEAFQHGTEFLFYAITENTKAFSLVGGGDTISAISKEEYIAKISHLSTGGGAMLEFIEKGTLPGIEALKK